MNSNLTSSKNFTWLFSVLMIVLAIFVAFSAQLPSADNYQSGNEKEFSQQNVLKHLKVISGEAHYVGAPAHTKVRKYLVDELEALCCGQLIPDSELSFSSAIAGATI